MKEAIKKLIRYHEMKQWYEKYERVLLPGTMAVGVVVDALTFASINITTSFFLLGLYAVLAGGIIFFQQAYDAGRVSGGNAVRYLRLSVPLILQFAFGQLLSASFIFYFFSGSVFASWPIFLALAFLMVSNEVFRKQYLRPTVQISIFFFIIFSLASITLPFAFHSFGPMVFLLSGAVAIAVMAGYGALLGRMVPKIKDIQRRLAISAAAIVVFVSGLYFLNMIPPIPLALREAAVAHEVVRTGGGYTLRVEEESFLGRLTPGRTIHADGKVFVYTAIYAPSDLKTTIVHHWQQYDETHSAWVTTDRLPFDITGGAKMGYRGYSFKSGVPPGEWRVDVETERGQVLGRVRFRVVETEKPPALKTVVK